MTWGPASPPGGPRQPQPTRSAPTATPPSPGGQPPDVAPPLDRDALWSAVVAAAGRGMDAAMIAPLSPVSFEGRALRLRCDGSDAALAATLARQTIRIAELVERATGRRVVVSIDPPAAAAAAPARAAASELEAARQHPLVREAMQLFEGTVTEVTPLGPTLSADGDSTADPDADLGAHPDREADRGRGAPPKTGTGTGTGTDTGTGTGA